MNLLIAKVVGREKKYEKLLSDKSIYDLPDDLEHSIDYKPDCKLEEEEWFHIYDFSKQKYSLDIISQQFDSTNFRTTNKIDSKAIEFICSYQDNNYIFFQKIQKSQLLKKKILRFNQDVVLDDNVEMLIINKIPDAIYSHDLDTLYFQKLSTISSIFIGIAELYREATDQETGDFLHKSSFIMLSDNYDVKDVKTANRRRIALASETLKNFDDESKSLIFEYVSNYCPGLEKMDEKFIVKSEEDLKKLLYGIEQRYYTTPIGSEKRLANSVIALE